MSGINFLGDVWLPNPFVSRLHLEDEYIFNLESPITKTDDPAYGKINLKTDGNYIAETFGKRPIAVCLANNHIMDHGKQGLIDTLDSLKKENIGYYGCGALDDNCNNPLLLEMNGLKIALLGYVCPTTHPLFVDEGKSGVMPNNLIKIKEDILSARVDNADRVIVSIHWGAEEVYLPRPEDIRIAREIVDAGADLIIGHHSHCIQPVEVYKGKYIFYGLGNCIMPDICVPINNKAEPAAYFRKRQKIWNKYSLLVRYSIVDQNINVVMTYFDANIIKEVPLDFKKLILKHSSNDENARRYKRSYIYCRLRTVVSNYISSPKVPRLSHMKSIMSLIRNKNYE